VYVILQFPSEPLAYRELRADALDRFRWRCRIPVIRNYGLESADMGIYVTQCDACQGTTAKMRDFGDVDPDLTLDALEAELRMRASSPRHDWQPKTCPACDAPDPKPISAIYARYLPEAEVDLQLEFVRAGSRVVDVQYHLMNEGGVAQRLERPVDLLAFADRVGAPLSLRGLWGSFVSQNVYAESMVLRQVQEGYYIGMRPFTDDLAEAEAMFEGFGPWIESLRENMRYDAIVFLNQPAADGVAIDFTESYQTWLGGYAHEITQSLIEPFAVADSDVFLAIIDDHARRYGLEVQRTGADGEFSAQFRGAEFSLVIDLAPILYRILHEGESFERGIQRHFLRQLRAFAAAAELTPVLRAALPDFRVQVIKGRFIELLDPRGRRTCFGDLIRIATTYDMRTPEGYAALMQEVAPGARHRMLTLPSRPLDIIKDASSG
jgi:hypothetical protein